MKRSVAKGIVISILVLLITGILKFYANRYFVLNLGLETLGVIKIFEQILGYLSLAELGVGTASMYSLYKPLADGNYDRVKEVLYTVDKLYAKIVVFIFIVGGFATFILPALLKDIEFDYKIILYWIMYLINTCLSYIAAKYSILYNADRRVNFVKISQGSSFVAFKVLQIISLVLFQSLFMFLLLLILNTLTNIIIFAVYYRRKYSRLRALNGDYHIDKSIIRDTKHLFIHKLSYIVLVNTDIIIISYFICLTAVGIYASYLLIFQMLFSFVGSVNSVVYPHVGRFIAINEKSIIYRRFKQINIIYLFAALIILTTTYNLIQPFMNIWINNKFDEDLISLFLCISYFLLMFRSNLEMFKKGSGFFRDIYVPIIEAGLNLGLSLVLVQSIGVLGVVIATVVSQVVAYLVLKPLLTYRECFDKNFLAYAKDYAKYLIYAVVSVAASQFIITKLDVNIKSLGDFIVSGLVIVILLVIINTLIFVTERDFRKQFINTFKLIKNKFV